jgi:monoamine oxidase
VSDFSLQPHLRTLMADLVKDQHVTFDTAEQYIGGKNVFVDFEGHRSYYYEAPPKGDQKSDGLPPISDDAKADVIAAFGSLSYMSAEVDLDARWRLVKFEPLLSGGIANTVEADAVTLHNWMESTMSERAAKALLAAMFRGTMGLEPQAISLLHVLFFLKTFGSDPMNVTGSQKGQMQHLRLPAGVGRIIDAIGNAIGPEAIHTGAPVRDIAQDGNHAIVSSDSVTVKARRVIVATTTTAVNLIRFNPPLPPDRAQLQQRMCLGSFWKIWLVYDKPFWRPDLSGQVVSVKPGSFVSNTRDSTLDGDNEPGLLTCFIDADKAREFGAMTREKRRATVIDEMVHAFGDRARELSQTIAYPAVLPQNPEPDAYFEWNWSLPEFVRGDYAGAPGPGVYTAYGFGPAIQTACGRVHWAGSDTGKECYGGMTGAVEAGDRAAAEVLQAEKSAGKTVTA